MKTVWILFTFNVSLWSLGIYFLFLTNNEVTALFWSRFLNMASLFIPAFLFKFMTSFYENDKKIKLANWLFLIPSIFVFLALLFPKYYIPKIKSVIFFNSSFLYPTASILYIITSIYFAILTIYALTYLFLNMQNLKTIKQNQARYIFWGFVIGFSGGCMAFPPVFNINIAPIGIYLTPFYIITTTIAIIKHRLMDINLAWRYLAKYIVYYVLNTMIFIGFYFLVKTLFFSSLHSLFYTFIFAVFFIPSSKEQFLKKINNILFKKQNKVWQELKQIAKNTTHSYQMRDIIDILIIPVPEALDLTHSAYYELAEDPELYKLFLTNDGASIPSDIKIDNPVIEFLKKEKRKIYKEDIIALGINQKLIEYLKKLPYELYFPIFFNNELIGIVCYGKKKDNIIYHKQDIEYLDNIITKTQNDIINVKMVEMLSKKYADEFTKIFKNKYTDELLEAVQRLERVKTKEEFREVMDIVIYTGIGASGITIYLYNEETEKYEYQKITTRVDEHKKERRHVNLEREIYYKHLNPIQKTIKEKEPIIAYLKKRKRILKTQDIYEASKKLEMKELEDMAKLLKSINAVLVAPLGEINFLGFIVFGSKVDGENYTDEEIKVLTFLLKTAQNILSNLYFKEKALTDELMGIYNKRYLHRQLQEEVAYTLIKGQSLSYIMIDIDHFKKYNDTCGHPVADELLKKMGNFMKHAIRPTDEVFRYGGEEIGITLPNTTREEVKILAERIREDIKTNEALLELEKKNKQKVTISIGTATLKEDESIDDMTNREIRTIKNKMIEVADAYLYKAKENGRDRVECSENLSRYDFITWGNEKNTMS
ncbi:diguanylate cyclase [bacterium]